MNAPADIDDLSLMMTTIARDARRASTALRRAATEQKNAALKQTAVHIEASADTILAANAIDVANATENGLSAAMVDRLKLDPARLDGIVAALNDIAALPDPVGVKISERVRPNGLRIERVRTPIGVIAVIYESRPNVTIDAGALCLKSGNAAILRGGSEALNTSKALHDQLQQGLTDAGLPTACVQLVPTADRAAVGMILGGLNGDVDLIIPRGGKSLVARVQAEARAPVLSHLDGLCHVYVDKDADIEKAVAITVNAKMRRTGVCGAAETLLIDEARLSEFLPPIAAALRDAGCHLKADARCRAVDPSLEEAAEPDFETEYLDAVLSVAAVHGVGGAVDHIATYSSGHTETIITENDVAASKFLNDVDSAIVMHNASTQFADGGEFGLGAEIGIATGRLHARGPVGLEELTTYKNVVHGVDHVRD
ncbi:MAG: glutamate-5-semialdehyde dehydrogenase [Pseudomonadota bacterium]